MLFLFFALVARTISGAVVDTTGNPVPGAAVWVPGGPGTYALEDGSFVLDVPEGSTLIRAKALGFAPGEARIGPLKSVKVVLVPTGISSREVIVTASARKALFSETPVSVKRVEATELERTRAFPRIEEALKDIPGCYPVGSDYLTQVPSVRGMARGRSLLLLNDMRIVDDRGVGPSFFVHPGVLSGVEVLSGPSSLLYGSGAIGGVIGAYTSESRGFGISYNSVNHSPGGFYRWSFEGLRTGLWWQRAGDYSYPDAVAENSGFKTLGGFLGIRLSGLSVEYIYAHPGDIGRPNDNPNKTATYSKDYHDLVRLSYETVSGGVMWRMWVWGHQKFKEAEVIKVKPDDSLTEYETTVYNGTDAGGTLLATGFLGKHILTGGVSGFLRKDLNIKVHTTRITFSGYTAEDTVVNPTHNAGYTELGLFLMDEFPAGPVRLRAGLRGDRLSWNEERNPGDARGAWTGETGLVLPLARGFELICSGRKAFRAPGLRELYYTGETPRAYQYANPALSPEMGLSAEAGFRWSSPLAFADGEVFYTHVDSLLTQVVVSEDSSFYQNAEKAFIKGVELELGLSAGGFTLTCSGFAMEGKNLTDLAPLNDIAPPSWSVRAGYDPGGFFLWTGARGRAAKRDPGPKETERDAFWLLDAGAGLRFLGSLRAELSVSNALNREFYENADRKALPGPGRNLSVGLYGEF